MDNKPWKQTVGTLITAVWIYTLAGIFGSIISAIDTIHSGFDIIGALTGDGGGSGSFMSFWEFWDYMCTVLVVIGYILFYCSLNRFEKLQINSSDTRGAHKVKISYILLILAAAAGLIPFAGWIIKLILIIISYVKLLSGYRSLKRSEVLPQQARDGFARLYSCSVWLLVFGIIGGIPAIGPIIEGVASIVIFFLVLSGWKTVRLGAPALTVEKAQSIGWQEVPANVYNLSRFLTLFFALVVIDSILNLSTWLDGAIYSPISFFISVVTAVMWLVMYGLLIYRSTRTEKYGIGRLGLYGSIILGVGMVASTVVQCLMYINSDLYLSVTVIYRWVFNAAVFTIGWVLFALGTRTSLGMKIFLMAQHPLYFLCAWLVQSLINWEDPISGAVYSLTSMVLNLLIFIILIVLIKRWKKASALPFSPSPDADTAGYTDWEAVAESERDNVADESARIKSGNTATTYTREHVSSQVRNYAVGKLEEIISSSGMYKAELVEAARHELEVRHKAEGLKDKVVEFDDARIAEILSNPGTYVDELVLACNLEKAKRDKERELLLQKEREEARLKAETEAKARKQHRLDIWRKIRLYVFAGVVVAVAAGIVIYLTSDSHYYTRGMRLWKADNVEKGFTVLSRINNPDFKNYSTAKYHVYLYNMNYVNDTSAAVTALKAAAENNTESAWIYCPTAVRTYADYLTSGSMPSYIPQSTVNAASLYSVSPSTDDQLKAGVLYYEGGAFLKAKEIFEAHSGSGTAKGYLGMMYLYGLAGHEQNFDTAYDYLMEAPDELPFVVHKGDLTLYLRNLKKSNSYRYVNINLLKEAKKYYDIARMLDPENEEYRIRKTVTEAVCKAYEDGPRSSTSWDSSTWKTIYHSKYWDTYTFTVGDSHGYYCGVVSDIRHGQTPNGWGAFSWDSGSVKITKYSNLKETDSYGIAIFSDYEIRVGKIENNWNLSEGVVTRRNGTKYRVE